MDPRMIQQIKNMMNQLKMAQNPQMFLNQMFSNSPQLQMVLNLIKNNGGNPKQVFMNLASQAGIDPQTIINQLQ
jgi:hypothetical protein